MLRAELDIRADARRFRNDHPFLRRAGTREGPPALVVSLTDWPYQLKIEGMLLKALEGQGLRPYVLTSAAIRRRARRYLDTFGFEELIDLERFSADAQSDEIATAVDAFMADRVTVQRLKNLRFRETYVGRQVLSSLSRSLLTGSVDLSDPEARSLLTKLLPQAMALCVAAESMLEEIDPAIMIFNEARYAGYGPIFETALRQRRNVIQFVHGFSDDTLVLKRYTGETSRFHPRSLGEAAWNDVAREPWTSSLEEELASQFEQRYAGKDLLSRRLHRGTRARGRDALLDELALDPQRPVAVVFSHVLWDANLFYGDDLFEDQEEWLVETVREAAANPSLNWIVKLHPANVWKLKAESQRGELNEVKAIRAAVGELPQHVKLLLPDTDISTVSLFGAADYALTIRGTIGIEAPCYGVPVVTAGTSHYSGRGFTLDSPTVDAYRRLLRGLQDVPPLTDEQVQLAKKHAHALFCRRPLRFTSFETTMEPVERMGHPLDHNVELLLRSWDDLVAAPDLRAFAEWAVDRTRDDYLSPLAAAVVER